MNFQHYLLHLFSVGTLVGSHSSTVC